MSLRIKRRTHQFKHGLRVLASFLETFPFVLDLRRKAKTAGKRFIALSLPDVMGDIISAEPTIRKLRAKHLDAHIYWIVSRQYADLVKYHPDLTGFIPVLCYSEAFLLEKFGGFDEFHDMYIIGRCCYDCGFIRQRPGIRIDKFYLDHTLGQAAASAGGLPVFEEGPVLHLPAHLDGLPSRLGLKMPYIVVHGHRPDLARTWASGKWTNLVENLSQRGFEVVEIGGQSIMKGTRDMTGRLSLLDSAAVIREATLFIGIDSGPTHIANAVGTPGVVLLGKFGNFGDYMPYSGGYQDGTSGSIVRYPGNLQELSVEKVLAAVLDRLSISAAKV